MQAALVLIPDFATILLGAGLRRWMHISDDVWTVIEKLVYYVLFPALLFSVLVSANLDFSETAPMLATGIIILLSGMALAFAVRPFLALSSIDFASRFQCAFRFNTYIGIAVAGKLYGDTGIAIMSILCGSLIPLANIASVWMLAHHGKSNVWGELVRNPLILSTVAGLLWNAFGFPVSEPILQFLTRLGQAAITLGLLCVGAALKWSMSFQHIKTEGWFIAIKLLMLPVAAWFAGRWLGLQHPYFEVAIIFASVPTASTAYILAARMGGDGSGVAWLVSAGTIVAPITMTLWISLLLRP
jgi:malonate transporter and related proteins